MARNSNFLKINWKAATLTGAIIGFLAWIFVIPWYNTSSFGMYGIDGLLASYVSPIFIPVSAIIAILCGALTGLLIALVYNRLLKL